MTERAFDYFRTNDENTAISEYFSFLIVAILMLFSLNQDIFNLFFTLENMMISLNQLCDREKTFSTMKTKINSMATSKTFDFQWTIYAETQYHRKL